MGTYNMRCNIAARRESKWATAATEFPGWITILSVPVRIISGREFLTADIAEENLFLSKLWGFDLYFQPFEQRVIGRMFVIKIV